jgi:SAM-dependent methyltransferase
MLIPVGYRNEQVLSDVEKLWKNAHPKWNWKTPNPYQAEYSWAVDRLVEAMGSLSTKKRKKTVMDAGGGRGALQHVIAAMGASVLNVDAEASPHASKIAEPTEQLRAQLDATGLEPGSFDGIVAVSAIEHNEWKAILRIVRHLVRLLKPRAPLVLTFPCVEKRAWIPAGGWPLPRQAGWPACYLFDENAARELVAHVEDEADLDKGSVWLGDGYAEAWKKQRAVATYEYPYLSAGLVLRRKSK